MYLEHFGLKEFPFRMTPDSRFLFLGKDHSRAISYMEYTVWNRDSFVVITGEIGAGKTTLIHKLLAGLDDRVEVARIHQTQLDEREFIEALLLEFGMEMDSGASKVKMLGALNDFLIEQYAAGRRVVLVVDEAQNLDRRVLEEVRLLSGLETEHEKLLNLILAGQPELRELLDSPGMEQMVQRIRLRYHIGPLSEQETTGYIAHRLSVAGGDARLIPPEAVPIIHRYTGGIPRLINNLCDTTLVCGFAEGISRPTMETVQAAIEELQWRPYSERKGAGGDKAADNGVRPPIPDGTAYARFGNELKALEEQVQKLSEQFPGR